MLHARTVAVPLYPKREPVRVEAEPPEPMRAMLAQLAAVEGRDGGGRTSTVIAGEDRKSEGRGPELLPKAWIPSLASLAGDDGGDLLAGDDGGAFSWAGRSAGPRQAAAEPARP